MHQLNRVQNDRIFKKPRIFSIAWFDPPGVWSELVGRISNQGTLQIFQREVAPGGRNTWQPHLQLQKMIFHRSWRAPLACSIIMQVDSGSSCQSRPELRSMHRPPSLVSLLCSITHCNPFPVATLASTHVTPAISTSFRLPLVTLPLRHSFRLPMFTCRAQLVTHDALGRRGCPPCPVL